MSTALLMADNWQPTVLQLLPFSSNNASNAPVSSLERARSFSNNRGFPTLAVTRTKGKRDGGKLVRVSSERLPRAAPQGASPERAKSEYNSRIANSLVTTERVCSVNNFNERTVQKTPELSDSVDSSDSLSITELPRNVKLLPKPSPCKSVDGRYFLPQNGFWRSVTMTPGELDLQKHREKSVKDNLQPAKNKKYKLNVNQLPRSTTPINDNDPDKLNIKQVIKYLQTKDTTEITTKSQKLFERRVKSGYPTTTPAKISLREPSEKQEETASPMSSFRREVTNVTQSTSSLHPNHVKRRGHRPKRDENTSKSNDNKSSFRNAREFRLHRFLTMAPNADEFTHVTQTMPISSFHKRLLITECSKSADVETDSMRNSHSPLPPYLPSRQGERYAKLHYRLPNRRQEPSTTKTTTSISAKAPRELDVREGIIRLPSMSDYHNDSDNDDLDDHGWPRRMRSTTGSVDSLEVNRIKSSASSSERDLDDDSENLCKLPPKKVTINVPREAPQGVGLFQRERSPHDYVRLSLRQEQSLTREKSYMSDMSRGTGGVVDGNHSPRFPAMVPKREVQTDDEALSRNS